MQNFRKQEIEYDPPPKTHFLAKIAFFLIAVLIVVAIVALVKDKKDDKRRITGVVKDRPLEEVKTGQPLATRFFEVVIDSVQLVDSISYTYNRGLVKSPVEPGNKYFVLYITLKNTDTESKMMPEGLLTIEQGVNELKYADPEIFTAEGWGAVMVNIDPGITRKTRLVYKIPAGITGKAYYYADVNYNRDRIFLANLQPAAGRAGDNSLTRD